MKFLLHKDIKENKEIASRTNSTFGFCRHARPTLKKPKELFFANTRQKDDKYDNR